MGQRKARRIVAGLGGQWVNRYRWPFTTVVSVDLSRCSADDADLAELACLRNLEQLDLRGCRVTDAGLKALRGMLRLWKLSLESTSITDAGLVELAHLTGLRDLNLSRTAVSDAGLQHLVGLTALRQLYLAETQVTDAGMAILARLHRLKDLSLLTTRLGDAGLLALAGLPELESVVVSDTAVTHAGESLFRERRPLVIVAGVADPEREARSTAAPMSACLRPLEPNREEEYLAARLNRLYAAANSMRGRNPRGHESAVQQLAELRESLSEDPERMARVVGLARQLSNGRFEWEL